MDFGSFEIHFHVVEAEGADGDQVLLFHATQQGFDAGQEFTGIEGNRQAIVGAELQARDTIHDPGGQHQDRGVDAGLAQVAADAESGLGGENGAQDDERRGALQRPSEAGLAIGFCFDNIAIARKKTGDCYGYAGIVFNQEDFGVVRQTHLFLRARSCNQITGSMIKAALRVEMGFEADRF